MSWSLENHYLYLAVQCWRDRGDSLPAEVCDYLCLYVRLHNVFGSIGFTTLLFGSIFAILYILILCLIIMTITRTHHTHIDYIKSVIALQAHWQSTSVSVPLGDMHLSSVLKDESAAGVNKWIANDFLQSNRFSHLNIIEVDNVCDGGQRLLAALRAKHD